MPTSHKLENIFSLPYKTDSGVESAGATLSYGSLYENGIPAVIEAEMERMYENFFSSPARFKVYGEKTGIEAFVARKDNHTTSIIAFRRIKKKIVVLNEQIELAANEINHFSTHIFSRFKGANSIFFKAIKTDYCQLAHPNHSAYFTNDIVVTLPASEQAYLAELGKSTRENVKRYLKILKRDFPTFEFATHDKVEQCEESFHQIIDFNRSRMAGKDKISGLNQQETERLWKLVEVYGLVSTITIDGKVRAGTISYRVGSNYFVRVIAHDSDFSAYSLGILVTYLTICECIKRGGKEFHFLWGQEQYKFRLLGKQRDFDSLTIYRSKTTFMLHGGATLRSLAKVKIGKAKLWVLDPANRDKAIPKYALRVRDILRRFRQ
jgi:hypothetical protein